MRVDTDTAVRRAPRTYLNAKPGSEEWKAAREQLEQVRRPKQSVFPVERHKQRMSALYVDAEAPTDGTDRQEKYLRLSAFDYLQDAANDYSVQYDRYTDPETYKPDDPELYTALEEWIGRPILPPPERPELPPWLAFELPPKP